MNIYTLKETADRVRAGTPYRYALDAFIKGFKSVNPLTTNLIQQDPGHIPAPNYLPAEFYDAHIAGLTGEITFRTGQPSPEWVRQKHRYLKEPFYTTRTKAKQGVYFRETPPSYRIRNLYCGKVLELYYGNPYEENK